MPASQSIPARVGRERDHSTQIALFHLIFFLSGIAGLGYELVWARMFSIGLGHEMPGVLAVVAAIFGGLGLGSLALDGAVSRAARPARWYAMLEAIIGAWGLVLLALLPWCNRVAVLLIGLDPTPLRQWAVAFGLPFVALLPATVAMGGSLPAMERAVSRLPGAARCLGGLYAANTFGALTGVLATTFVVVPALGFRATVLLLVTINFLCAVAVLLLKHSSEQSLQGQGGKRPTHQQSPIPPHVKELGSKRLALTVFVTGLLGIGYEVIGVRVMSQALENTVYSFAGALAVYLLGTATGAALYQRFLAARPSTSPAHLLGPLLASLALACVLGIHMMGQSNAIYDGMRERLGGGQFGSIAAEMILAAAAFGLPTIAMGAIFSHLVQSARRADGGVGRAAAMNTFGGALAAAVFGVAALPLLGAKLSLGIIALGYLLLIPRWSPGLAVTALVSGLLLAVPANLHLVQAPASGRVREFRDGVMAAVAVVEDRHHARHLKVNNRFIMGGTGTTFLERRLGHIPLLLHRDPRRALFLGVGTGVSLGIAGSHPDLRADAVELVPEVVDVLAQFEPENLAPQRQPNVRIFVADARRFVLAATEHYDVIIGDLFHPARDGAGSLYTLEHFQAVRHRLAENGIFCQWLPLYQLDEPTLKVIVRTFLEAFPAAYGFIAHYNASTPTLGLIGSHQPLTYSGGWFEKRVTSGNLLRQLQELALSDSLRLFGGFILDQEGMREFAGDAPINTDDYPVVIFKAPRLAYQANEPSHGRLAQLLNRPLPKIEALIEDDAEFRQRLALYLDARNVFLRGMIASLENRQAEAIEAYVESARRCEEFNTGYVACISIAQQKRLQDPAGARQILEQLIKAQPNNPQAAAALNQIFER